MSENNSLRIRNLNDAFRTTFIGGKVMLTAGVEALRPDLKVRIMETVRRFVDFDEGNDPRGEHDFGSFALAGEEFFWKIDCYDADMRFGSDDPSDPAKTTRVLTIMFADEY